MGFWKGLGKVTAGTLGFTGKAAVATTKLAAKGIAVTAKTVYDHREEIGSAAKATGKAAVTVVGVTGYAAYKSAEWCAKKVAQHRQEIGGSVVGAANGVGNALADTTAHAYARKERMRPLIERIARQSEEYQRQVKRLYGTIGGRSSTVRGRDVLVDTVAVGGNTISSYSDYGVSIPPDVERAYNLAYPDLSNGKTFIEEIRTLDTSEVPGLLSGVKGKLFEIKYVDYLNDGNLPAGYHAQLASSATQPGWDIEVLGPDGHIRDLIQAKATDSVSYVKEALERYPHIDVVTTDEVHSHLVMQGFADHVIGSEISDKALQEMVSGASDAAVIHFTWLPSVLSLALIAFSAYSQEGLDAYEKSKNFGERSMRSYLAYLAGGALAVATHTWWLGLLGGMGTRLVLGSGNAKRQQLRSLEALVVRNDTLLKKLRATRSGL